MPTENKMVFNVTEFLKNPDLIQLDQLKKDDLVLLAQGLEIPFRVSMKKQTIKN